ncbi:MAG TPA: hypothetical protein VFM46_08695, partial [Pseudomonadales bacterium]|nr:hypothetical protein [Pseudomonadales bacterium]
MERQGKQLLFSFLVIASTISAVSYMLYENETKTRLKEMMADERYRTLYAHIALTNKLKGIAKDVDFLTQTSAVLNAAADPTDAKIAQVAHNFLAFSRTKQWFDQISWIDKTGQEQVRIDYNAGQPVSAQKETLQTQAENNDFQNTLRLVKGHYYVSPLTLNIQNNQIEQPYKPS